MYSVWCVALVPQALPCDWSGYTLATSAVAEWFNRECLPKFVNELAPPTLQTFGTSVRRVKGMVAFTLVFSLDACVHDKCNDNKGFMYVCATILLLHHTGEKRMIYLDK